MLREFASSVPDGWALATTGAITRNELCPGSDLDLFLLHPPKVRSAEVERVAKALWYPLWDAGVRLTPLTHNVASALAAGRSELQTATALLDLVLVGGDATLVEGVVAPWREQWVRRATHNLVELADSIDERHQRAGEVAFLLEPELKEGRGGIRDLHGLSWAAKTQHEATLVADELPLADASSAAELLLAVRAELHRVTRRPNDRLLLQEQDGVAQRLGFEDADSLMRDVASGARTIAWVSDRFWIGVRKSLRRRGRPATRATPIAPGFAAIDGALALTADAVFDSSLPLRAAALAAQGALTIETASLVAMAERTPQITQWTGEHRRALISLLGAGHDALPVVESLDRFGLVVHAVPEWSTVQSKPQRNAFHRFTVDRHLSETAANATAYVRRVARPDLLLLGAWLHDIGKGFPGDHTIVGEEIIKTMGDRMGFSAADVEVLVRLCRFHLLLPETATRRDLSDPGTIRSVTDAVETTDFADLLHAMTIADSLATGPAAWSEWKARLVEDLVDRVRSMLAGHQSPSVNTEATLGHHDLMERIRSGMDGAIEIDLGDVNGGIQQCTIATRDQLGLLRDIAGVLSVHGVEVLSVDAWTSDDGIAVDELVVARRVGGETNWTRVRSDLRLAIAGKLDVATKIADRVKSYSSAMRHLSAEPARAEVLVDGKTSATATIIEVRAPDGVGVLWRLARVLTEQGFNISTAKVATLGHEVVDAFYVTNAEGGAGPAVDDYVVAQLLIAATNSGR